jgi:hypothetical protein
VDITGCKLITGTVLTGYEPHCERATSKYGEIVGLAARQLVFVRAEDVAAAAPRRIQRLWR